MQRGTWPLGCDVTQHDGMRIGCPGRDPIYENVYARALALEAQNKQSKRGFDDCEATEFCAWIQMALNVRALR